MADEIVIVEDNSTDIILMLAELASLTNEKVVCRDAEEALAYLNRTNDKPILILLDLGLPQLDGATFAYRVRNNPETKSIPIIVVTGDPNDESRMFSLEVNGYLIKPLEADKLLKALVKIGLRWQIT